MLRDFIGPGSDFVQAFPKLAEGRSNNPRSGAEEASNKCRRTVENTSKDGNDGWYRLLFMPDHTLERLQPKHQLTWFVIIFHAFGTVHCCLTVDIGGPKLIAFMYYFFLNVR